MFLVSHKVVFIKNEAVLLRLTMRERARGFAATIYCITFWFSFCYYKVQFLWYTFQMHFLMGTTHFQKLVLRMKLFLSLLSFFCHIANAGVWHVVARVVIKIKIFHSCRSCSTRVIRVALMSLVSSSRVVKQTRPYYHALWQISLTPWRL